VKREVGANPTRSRRCKRGVPSVMPLFNGKAEGDDDA